MQAIKKVAVGISGGVDSAVSALLLKNKGFNLLGIYLRNWDIPDETGHCQASEDLEDAKYVCDKLKIPLKEVNFVKEYWNEVFSYMTEEYEKGFTPNPDVLCNKKIKFDLFFKYAMEHLKVDAIATGHYARSSYGQFLEKYDSSKNAKLLTSADANKDQTFFLCQISQQSLRRTMFPVGDLTKDLVRRIACDNGLEKIAKKDESTGICFIGKRNFQNFFAEYLKPQQGNFINISTGKIEGKHNGRHLWTIGQGCRIGGVKDTLYVADKLHFENDIVVASGFYHPVLFTESLYTEKPHWISEGINESESTFDCSFRFQHRKPLINCKVCKFDNGSLFVRLERPLRAITSGQYAVFYKKDECLGGVKITRPGPSYFSLDKSVPGDYDEYNEFKLQKYAVASS